MCWGFGVADVHMSQSGFLNSIELKRSSELLPKAAPRSGQRTNDDDVHAQNEHKSAEEPLMLACMALLCCANSVCDKDVFTAVVDSGLVFDGGLVVDAVSYSFFLNLQRNSTHHGLFRLYFSHFARWIPGSMVCRTTRASPVCTRTSCLTPHTTPPKWDPSLH